MGEDRVLIDTTRKRKWMGSGKEEDENRCCCIGC